MPKARIVMIFESDQDQDADDLAMIQKAISEGDMQMIFEVFGELECPEKVFLFDGDKWIYSRGSPKFGGWHLDVKPT